MIVRIRVFKCDYDLKSNQIKFSTDVVTLKSFHEIQWQEYESKMIAVFCEFLWHKDFVCINFETNLGLEFVHKPFQPVNL